jgi:hypothetical protein
VSSAFVHWCEVCGLELLLTPEIAYSLGWDFPPKMGTFGVISPRTCGACGVEGTAWFALAVHKQSMEEISEKHYATVLRIVKGESREAGLGQGVGAGAG